MEFYYEPLRLMIKVYPSGFDRGKVDYELKRFAIRELRIYKDSDATLETTKDTLINAVGELIPRPWFSKKKRMNRIQIVSEHVLSIVDQYINKLYSEEE